jgi:hypothetical protein
MAAEPSIAVRAKLRRLMRAGASFFGSLDGPHVPHPDVLQVPQPLAAVLITWSESAMVPLFHRFKSRCHPGDSNLQGCGLFLCRCGQPAKSRRENLKLSPIFNILLLEQH